MLARWPSLPSRSLTVLSCVFRFHQAARQRHSIMSQSSGQGFERLLVLDFEATCDSQWGTIQPQEVIEFPVLCLDVKQRYQLTSKFHRYVRPQAHPQLSPFCTRLTGIIQDMVEHEAPFADVLNDFNTWLETEGLLNKKFAFVTCGDWDLRDLLPAQCRHLGLEVPWYFKSWINVKMIFAEATGVYPRNLPHMMSHLNLPQLGRLHSGIDDCANIAAVIRRLERTKCVWHLTSVAQD